MVVCRLMLAACLLAGTTAFQCPLPAPLHGRRATSRSSSAIFLPSSARPRPSLQVFSEKHIIREAGPRACLAKEAEADASSVLATAGKPLSVNFHFTRECNYACKFCFHTAKTSFLLPLAEAKAGIRMLHGAGMEKINFSGGEPFLPEGGSYLGEMCKYAKEIGVDSVSIISNGSRITQEWMKTYAAYVDILGVSCDSQVQSTLYKMGRMQGQNDHLMSLRNVRAWCIKYGVGFKINTVVTSLNYKEDMSKLVQELAPMRWKVFQCLLIEAENTGQGALRQASALTISDKQFRSFLDRHAALTCLVPESNEAMRDSYLILDERLRFLDNTEGSKKPS